MSYSIKPFHVVAIIAIVAIGTYAVLSRETGPSIESLSVYDVQTAKAGEVEISIQPDLQEDEWTFEMSMNTHSTELSEDMAAVTVLRTGGKEYAPLRWEGSPSGGHHRDGKLVFRPARLGSTVVLVFKNLGGVEERIFEWNN